MDEGSIPRAFTLSIMVMALLSFTYFPTVREASSQASSAESPVTDVYFDHQRLYKEGDLIFRAAFGDVIPGNGHIETVTCAKNGVVAVTYGSDMSWRTETADRIFIDDNPNDPAEVYSIAVADILPEREGDEIVTVDMDYNVRLIMYDEGSWTSEVIFVDPGVDWLYEVAVGDIIPGGGPEIVIVGESQRAILISREEGEWTGELLFKDNFPLDTCFIDDILPEVPGNEILVGGIDKNLTLIRGSPGNWSYRDIAFLGSSIIDCLTIDLDPTVPGKEIYASTFSGLVYQVAREGDNFRKKVVHNEGAMAYGLEGGNIEGVNVISMATWNSRVALLYYEDGFAVREVYREEFYLIGTGIHDIDPYHKGNEIVGLSALGYLTIIFHDDPGVDLILPFRRTVVSEGEELTVPFIARYKGGYEGEARMSVIRTSGETGADPSPLPEISGSGFLNISLTHDEAGTYVYEFRVAEPPGSPSVELTVEVDTTDRPVGFSTVVINGSVGADKQLVKNLELQSVNDVMSPMVLSPERVPTGLEVELDPESIDPVGVPVFIESTIRVRPDARIETHRFFLLGGTSDGRNRAVGYSITVQDISVQDFQLLVQGPSLELEKGANATFELLVVPISGFNGDVSLSLVEPIEDLEVTFSGRVVSPPATVEIKVEVLNDDGPYFLDIRGRSGDLERSDSIRVDTSPPGIFLEIEGPTDVLFEKEEDGSYSAGFFLNLTPVNGVVEDLTVNIDLGGSEGTVSMSPTLERVPYRTQVLFRVSVPSNSTLEDLEINFSDPDHTWVHLVSFSYPEDENGSEEGGIELAWILIAFFVVVAVAAAFLLIFGGRGNPLKTGERVEVTDAGTEKRSGFDKTAQRRHGIERGMDRMGGPKR